MNLTDYIIHGSGETKQINFSDSALINLEEILNYGFNNNNNIDFFLNKLSSIKSNWTSLNLLDSEWGFWDDGELAEKGVTGHWFYLLGEPDIDIYICVETKKLFIENEIMPHYPIVELSVDEFISILEQWKEI